METKYTLYIKRVQYTLHNTQTTSEEYNMRYETQNIHLKVQYTLQNIQFTLKE